MKSKVYFIYAELKDKNTGGLLMSIDGTVRINETTKFQDVRDYEKNYLLDNYNKQIKEIEKNDNLIQCNIKKSNIKKHDEVLLIIKSFNKVENNLHEDDDEYTK